MVSPFNGAWKINLEKSQVWDASSSDWVSPDPIGIEEVTMYITDEIYDQVITVGVKPTLHMGYTAQWGGDWVPYMLHAIVGSKPDGADHPKMELGPEMPRDIGKPIAWVKMIHINDRFHYRISRPTDWSSPGYAMSRQMHEGDNSYTATVISPAGVVVIRRHFDRVSNAEVHTQAYL